MTPPKIYGLIGYPVKHSLSPVMHNAAFQALKIDAELNAEYRLFEVKPEELKGFLLGNKEIKDTNSNSFSIEDLSGFNITIPHKVRAREILEKKFSLHPPLLEDENYVRLTGAINTVKRDGDILHYYNTDATGFRKSLKEDLKFVDAKGTNVFIIGCGGAGRAVIAALGWRQLKINKIYVNDISNEAVNSAREHFSQFSHFENKLKFITNREDIPNVIKNCHLLVNASPIGMKDEDPSVIDKTLLHENLYVYDVIYKETRLIRDAKSLGRHYANGLGMLLYQGVDAFELWTEKRAPVEVMRKALEEAI